jgi:hypothetical protein
MQNIIDPIVHMCIMVDMEQKQISPLGKWIEDKALTEGQVVELLRDRVGMDLSQSTISRYRTGRLRPTIPMRLAFEILTGGAVPAKAWDDTSHTPILPSPPAPILPKTEE